MSLAAARISEFHEAFDVKVGSRSELGRRRYTMHEEEHDELREQLLRFAGARREGGDLEALADELADEMVLLYGTAELFGIDLDEAFAIKMNANMAKLPKCHRCHGHGREWTNAMVKPVPSKALCEACHGTGKGPPIKRADGKILKPEGWRKPSMAGAIR